MSYEWAKKDGFENFQFSKKRGASAVSEPPSAETMNAISKGIGELSRMSGCPAEALTRLVLASDAARAAGVEPGGTIATQGQAEAVLALLRSWYRQMRDRRKGGRK